MRVFILAILAALSLLPALATASEGFPVRVTGTVVWVADGDTFRFSVNEVGQYRLLKDAAERADKNVGRDLRVDSRFDERNHSFLVRVANIDTAESKHPDNRRNTDAGREAAEYVRRLIQGGEGTVECYTIGYWGRPICSLWTEDLELGAHLIEKGYSRYETEFGRHPTMDSDYRRAANQ